MRILMVSAEVETFARTGGLGDVVYGLSRALARLGHDVCVVTQLYGNTAMARPHRYWHDAIPVRVGWGDDGVRHVGVAEVSGGDFPGSLRFCLVADDYLFGSRDGIYGDARGTFGDNDLRFATMSRAALEIAARLWPDGFDAIHAHDWHAALAVVYAKATMGESFARIPAIFTIHNLAYQGLLDFGALDRLGIPRALFQWSLLEQDGAVNLMKGAIALSNLVTTVSPTYSREIRRKEHGFHLDWFLRMHERKLVGVTNGIDEERFDPRTDTRLVQRYSEDDMRQGKLANKRALCNEFALVSDDAPLFASVSRLTDQKGIDLFIDAIPALVDRGANVVLVGTGDRRLEDALHYAGKRFPGHVGARVAFDSALAGRINAACDFFVVPSRFEPCGLTQLYAMRYGAVPVVTDVGGLHDTVEPANLARGTGTGFVAASPSVVDLLVACEDALSAYLARHALHDLRLRGMARDSSWNTAAREYVDGVYGRAGVHA
ncbi:glycogen synthase GlgA [soil metagenome]